MENNFKKLLSLVIALVMVVGMIPGAAFAAETNEAEVNGVEYATLQEAIDAAGVGDTVTLLTDLTFESDLANAAKGYFNVAADDKITLDLNSKTINVTDNSTGNFILFYSYGELTLKNGTVNLTATNDRDWNAESAIVLNRGGILNVESGVYTHNGGTDMAFVLDNSGNYYGDATTNIYDGTTLTSSYIAIRNRMEQNTHGASGTTYLNVYGGTISGTSRAIWAQAASTSETAPATGEIVIKGGNVGLIDTPRSTGAVSMTTIEGGTVSAFKGEIGELTVTGGTLGTVTMLNTSGEEVDYTVNSNGQYVEQPAVTGLQGSGTAADPYLINNIQELKWFRDDVNTYTSEATNQYRGKYVRLNADIDLAGENWEPIGTNSVGDHSAFLGVFDGGIYDDEGSLVGCHTISNLYVNGDGDHLGFFARTGSYGDETVNPAVKNINFHNVDVSSNSTGSHSGSYVGGIIANSGGNTHISNVTVTGDVYVVGYGYVGGIVGHGYPKIDNCHVKADYGWVHAHYWCAGGIVGYAGEGGTVITNSSVSGLDIWAALGAGAAVAGLLQDGNKIENVSASNVNITSDSDYIMGYIAGNGEASTLTNVTISNVTATAKGETITSTDGVDFTPVAPELPTATVTKLQNEDLTFALNFLADKATDEQLAYYGDWYADFVLTTNMDVTFNANGGANGYLSGQYDAWSENWVSVPFEDVTVKANEPLKIMEYAAKMMGKPDLKLTYNDVANFVKDFDCGVYLDDMFVCSNPDLVITLELRMYNNEDETETYVIGDTYTYSIPTRPTATTKEVENEDLTFAMNFVADEVTTEQLDFYGSWYADFELTVNKDITLNANGGADGYLSGQYDKWSENWVNVPFKDVTLKAGESLKIMEYAAELMGEPGLKYTYKEVYEVVKDFDCGMFLEPAFIAANPDVEITLELKMYNPKNETHSHVIGETYIFNFDYVAYNTVTETFYDRADDALLAAKAGETVILLKDTGADDGKNYFELIVQEDVVFDLNGYTVTAKYMSSYGDTVDYSEANTGAVAVDPGRLLIQTDNEQVTVKTAKGFQFFEVEFILDRFDATRNHYAFVPMIEAAGAELLAPGVAVTGVSIQVNVSWKTSDGHTRNQVFSYSDEYVNGFIASYDPEEDWYGKMFTLTLNDTTGITDLSFTAYVVSDTGVKYPA